MPKTLVYLIVNLSLLIMFANKADAGKLHVIHSVCEEYQSAAAVFTAYVTDVQMAKGRGTPTIGPVRLLTVSMRVDEAFKGVKESDIAFTQSRDFENCSPVFTKDEHWLLYARRDPETDALHLIECSRSSKVEFASSDLRYLRALPEIARKTRLAGTIEHYARRSHNHQMEEQVGNAQPNNPLQASAVLAFHMVCIGEVNLQPRAA
jgi:hypothetical protein